jgi:hypothetical protein
MSGRCWCHSIVGRGASDAGVSRLYSRPLFETNTTWRPDTAGAALKPSTTRIGA